MRTMSIDPSTRRNFTGPISDDDRTLHAPAHGSRCKRCHRTAPRVDGIPCALCAPGDTSPEAAMVRAKERSAEAGAVLDRMLTTVLERAAARAESGGGQ